MSAQNPLQTTLPIRARGVPQTPVQPQEEPRQKKDIAGQWDEYFGRNQNDLAKWKQLCRDLGKPSETFTSKTQCQKVRSLVDPQVSVYCLWADRLTR